jgi:chromosome segregation ATPase
MGFLNNRRMADPHQELIDKVAELGTKEAGLLERLTAAENEHRRIAARRVELLETDDAPADEIVEANRTTASLAEQISGMRQALDAVRGKLREAEADLAQARDRSERERFAAWAADKLAKIRTKLELWQSSSADLAELLRSTSQAGAGIALAMERMVAGLNVEVAAVTREFDSCRTAVLNGERAIPNAAPRPADPPLLRRPHPTFRAPASTCLKPRNGVTSMACGPPTNARSSPCRSSSPSGRSRPTWPTP